MINVNLTNIDFNTSNVIFIDGLTLEMVKIKYNWLLNASIKDAIIGEDANGLVWYFGEWYDGEWYDGTWYSGTWYNGTWKNGTFNAFNLDKFQTLSQNFQVLSIDNTLSNFLNGIWENGVFNSGTFGVNSLEDWTNYTQEITGNNLYTDKYYTTFKKKVNVAGNIDYTYKKVATWIEGIFNSGDMYDCVFCDGVVKNGYINNIQWINGKFFNGVFNGCAWYNGLWYNGDFIKGIWYNGTFTKLDSTIISRFGYTEMSGSTQCLWKDGIWKNGGFYSGIEQKIHNISIWEKGTWENGLWYGGHFKSGTWNNGVWYNGIFGDVGISDWFKPANVYQIPNVSTNWINENDDIVSLNSNNLTNVYTGLNIISGYTSEQNYNSNIDYVWMPDGIVKATIDNSGLTDKTYWVFDWISDSNLSSNIPHKFNVDDTVYIESTIYTGISKVLSISTDGINYKLSLSGISLSYSQNSGRIYLLDTYNNFSGDTKSNILFFNGFDFSDFHYDIRGYQIKLKRSVSGLTGGEFNDDGVWFNAGVLDSNNLNINILEYTDTFFNNQDTDWQSLSNNTNISSYTNELKIDTIYKDFLYGKGFSDLWNLNNLNQYTDLDAVSYTIVSGYTNLFNVDYTNADSINDIDNLFNVYLRFNASKIEDNSISVKDINVRLLYKPENSISVWKNGTFENGTWINGTFENGKFLSGLWMEGTFKNGQMGAN